MLYILLILQSVGLKSLLNFIFEFSTLISLFLIFMKSIDFYRLTTHLFFQLFANFALTI